MRGKQMCLGLCLILIIILTGCSNSSAPVLSFRGHKVYGEEFSMYCDIVKRNLVDRNDIEELYNNAVQYAVQTYALYDLGKQLGVCDAFDFKSLQANMDQENEKRRLSIQNGNAVMGLKQFGLTDYFEYCLSECRYNVTLALVKQATDDLMESAREYYEKNKESYIESGVYEYLVTTMQDGKEVSERKMVSYEDLMTSYHSSDLLGDILLQGNIGEEYDIGIGKITVLNKEIEYIPFEDVYEVVGMAYVEKEYLPTYLAAVFESEEFFFTQPNTSQNTAAH